MAISIRNAYRAPWLMPLDKREIHKVLTAMMSSMGVESFDLELTLCDDAEMELCNRRHLACSGPTNVLAFPPSAALAQSSASIVLNLNALARECLLYGQDATEHMLRLLAHGLAHTAGYDHGDAMDAVCRDAEHCAQALLDGGHQEFPPDGGPV